MAAPPVTPELDPDALMTRAQAAEALSRAGFPTSRATLAKLAVAGTGPAYRLYGRRPLYAKCDLFDWAQRRAGAPRTSTRSTEAPRADQPAAA
jgi:hypothetical protein